MSKVIGSVVITVLAVALLWFIWQWGFCRFYVQPGYLAVITAKGGKPLPDGQILAKAGQKGIQEDVLGEGRYFLDPIMWEHQILPVTVVAPGKVGIVTAKIGEDLPEGEFLAEPRQKGIWRRTLGPGKYRLNPYGYQIDLVDAISIPVGYAGVITSLSGRQAPPGEFAGANEKGVRRDILQPGLYYVNRKGFKVDVLEIGVNQVSLLGKLGGEVITKGQIESGNVAMKQLQSNVLEEQKKKRLDYLSQSTAGLLRKSRGWEAEQGKAEGQQQAAQPVQQAEYYKGDQMDTLVLPQFVEFPSRDGFQISLDMTVEVELTPADIAWILSRYGDLPALVDKVIMPQITSIARNKGSEYGAKDFIMGEGREKFQTELTKALATTLAQRKIVVHNALIRHVEVPEQILDPIRQASIAIQQNLTNLQKQETAKKLGELNTEMTLIEQRRQQVAQETTKIKAEIRADEEKQAAEIRAEAVKNVAEIARETAAIEADTVRRLAEAEGAAIKMVEGEKAEGLKLKARALGDPTAYALWALAQSLNENVRINILHAGDGTLWTDLGKASLGDLGGAVLLKAGADGK
jgi:regulator of protease activity HflC (stomatin/prohibitin superfamily)